MPRPPKTPATTSVTTRRKPTSRKTTTATRKPRTPGKYPPFMKIEDRPAWEAQQEAKRLAEIPVAAPTMPVEEAKVSEPTQEVISSEMPKVDWEHDYDTQPELVETAIERAERLEGEEDLPTDPQTFKTEENFPINVPVPETEEEEDNRKWREAFVNTTPEQVARLEEAFIQEETENGTRAFNFSNMGIIPSEPQTPLETAQEANTEVSESVLSPSETLDIAENEQNRVELAETRTFAGACPSCSTQLYRERNSSIVRCSRCGYTRLGVQD